MSKDYSNKYCILGGGATGIGIGKCLKQVGIDFDIIEKEDDFGGNWYDGKPCAKMYRSAHLISSKTNTQFSDFPMPKDFPPYPNHKQMLSYLRSVAKHFGLYDHVQFNTTIENLEPVGDYWRVHLSNGEERLYKGMVVCNGMLRKKKIPSYPGKFDGETLHAWDYKSQDQIKDKRVLIIGAGNSGCDIAVDSAQAAEKTFHSTRRGYHYMPKFIAGKSTQDWQMEIAHKFKSQAAYWKYVKEVFKQAGFDGTDYGLPTPDHDIFQSHPIMNSLVLYYIGHGDITPKPDIKELKANSVIFEDDTEEQIDLIIYCTGYAMSFPFFSEEHLKLKKGLPDIYVHLFHRQYDNVLFSGYVNAPTGLGNIVNATGRLFATYFQALDKNTKAIQIFREMKKEPDPDLGNKKYMHTERHRYEVDLWQLLKLVNNLRAKFEEDI